MTKTRYHWKRFWCKAGERVNLSDDGFLVDPDAKYGSLLNQSPSRSSANVSTAPCLILLGEPGIGKSTALKDEYEQTRESRDDSVIWVDLRRYQTDQRLHEDVFESPAIKSWLAGSHRLHLFIDSMDEALMRIDNIGLVLLNEFQDLPTFRLNIRLACRTADWPRDVDIQLADLWGADKVGLYELAPLRRIDVQVAAKENALDSENFLDEVQRTNAVPLAIKPITLDFLLNTFKKHGTFPSTQVELYDQGCRLLCEDSRDQLRPAKPALDLTAGQRLAVASRIAAATILCNRNAIWTDIDRGEIPEEDLRIPELVGGKATWQKEEVVVVENAIWQGMDTGLFSSRGPSRLGWAHQTYAEFLAARFVVANLTSDSITSLILHEDGKVIPQLHELAAWLARMVPDLFRRFMKADPEFLLRSDAATADFNDRKDLVAELLTLYDSGELLDFDWDIRRRFQKLAHPGLSAQLRPYIRDKTKGIVVRRVAVNIAQACEEKSLEDDLVAVSLDASDIYEVRAAAAFCILRIGNSTAKRELRPLALGLAGPDPDDDLKGCALACTWPEFLTATELFGVLTPEKNTHRIGIYHTFLDRKIAEDISVADLPIALSWAADHSGPLDALDPSTAIADGIVARAMDHLDNPAVLNGLASTIQRWLPRAFISGRERESQFRAQLAKNDERRRMVLSAVLPLVPDKTFELSYLYGGSLIISDDFNWLLQHLRDSTSLAEEQNIVGLIRRMYDPRQSDQTDALVEACQDSVLLAQEFSWLLNPVWLGSPEAATMKTDWRDLGALTPGPEQKRLLEPPPQQRIAALLEKFAGGDLEAFWRLNYELTLEPDSTYYGDLFAPELTVMPGWKRADNLTIDKIIDASKHYLIAYDPPVSGSFVKTNTYPHGVLAGYRALRLIVSVEPDFLEHLPPICWQKWAAITLAFPLYGDAVQHPGQQELTRRAYDAAPAEILAALNSLIDKENEQHGILFALERISAIWDDRVATMLVEKLRDPTLKLPVWKTILSELAAHKVPDAQKIATECVTNEIRMASDERERAIGAAQTLIQYGDDAGWEIVWPAVQNDSKFGLDVFSSIAHSFDAFDASAVRKLTDEQIAELYIWLLKHVPYSDYHSGGGFVTPAQSLGHWRDAILVNLKGRGTKQACDGLRLAMVKFPDLSWLKWHLQEAEQVMRRRSWTPLSPTELIELAESPKNRLVLSGVQLLDILLESLGRLELDLQGETPAAPFLWNEIEKNCYRPKDEMRLSDYVKGHFEHDIRVRGIVVNREVQIRQGLGKQSGEETDIHVDAVRQLPDGEYDQISAIIEVKGCWNKDVMNAMETQLRDRYLKDNRCPFGLYLVGWFMCPQWDQTDYRKRDTPKLILGEARKEFENQAVVLSSAEFHLKAYVLNTALRHADSATLT